ncbi:hypothetical protein DPMN_141102 [Dreissena polymorpha]|uniref:Uncharacterized protein n=1 Tax=Dreissena polymorpha TaxID=45954 RepID=A0A9D4G8U5_DREPO|nr:hypothetical protein DPMN_141102 [Dreissena polymorpha]
MNTKLVCFLVCVIVATIVHGAAVNDVKEARRFLISLCDIRCGLSGGCYGTDGACDGTCYCYGSGYEHRCSSCDI